MDRRELGTFRRHSKSHYQNKMKWKEHPIRLIVAKSINEPNFFMIEHSSSLLEATNYTLEDPHSYNGYIYFQKSHQNS